MADHPVDTEFEVVRFLDELASRIVDDFVVGTVLSVRDEVAGALPLALTLYMAIWGYRMFCGVSPPRGLLAELAKVSVVLVLLLNFELYNRLVKEPVFLLPDHLAAIMVGAEVGSGVIELIDSVLMEGFRVGAIYWREAGFFDNRFGLLFVAVAVWIAVILPTAMATFLIVLAKLYLGALIAVGPAALLLTLFERTRGVFDRWVSEVLSKSLTVAFAILVPRVLLHHFLVNLQDTANFLADNPSATSTVIVILFFAVAQILFYAQVPGLAAALGGGIQLGPIATDRHVPGTLRAAWRQVAEYSEQLDDYMQRVESDRRAGAPGEAPSRWEPRWRRPW